ncbi:MAG: Gldg family protein [Christensenellales bacterium]|jgi:hypothetical protein
MNKLLDTSKRRLLPTIICLCILIISVAIVALADQAERRHALRLDFSFNSVTTQSERTTQVMRSLPYQVKAYSLATPGMEDQALLGLLDRLASLTNKFSYVQTSLVRDPLLVNTLSSSLKDEQVSADCLVLQCEHTGRARVLSAYDYLSQEFDIQSQSFTLTGLSYEKSIVEALLYLTMDSVPRIRILDGHGELAPNDTAYMENFLRSHHFEISRVNLLTGETLTPEELLMILSPQRDLLDSELASIHAFTAAGGNVLITSDYNDPDSLPNFDALYRQMGFERKSGIVVAEGADVNAYIDNPLFLTPYMNMTEPTAALIGAGQVRLRLPGARALDIAAQADGTIVDPLLTSGLAYLKPVARAEKSLAHEQGEEVGQFYLSLLSDYAFPDGTRARAMIIGNSAILVDSWLHEITYGAQFLLHLVNHLSAHQPVRLDIAPKALIREQLSISHPWVVNAVLIALPLASIALALPVLIKRRRR